MFGTRTIWWIRRVFLILAGALVIWMFIMGSAPQEVVTVRNWDSSWIGLDILECLGLVSTALLLPGRSPYLAPVAAASAMLFALDAWFDTMTSLAGSELDVAVFYAAISEIPLAVALTVIAVLAPRGLVRRSGTASGTELEGDAQ
ncbi:hypothetical protein KDL01_20010 [Actinospica durhamensis]|uniref:Uncharacterized protein n=1 Tax=Actinospica durhamensis TaxID=1508375 RepID=A0A941EQK1_9ACTN|nr:hypothetical protein [Actinospica durhamensis]MBR7835570.1 hypothetical protein [Actinospica durhamensis]